MKMGSPDEAPPLEKAKTFPRRALRFSGITPPSPESFVEHHNLPLMKKTLIVSLCSITAALASFAQSPAASPEMSPSGAPTTSPALSTAAEAAAPGASVAVSPETTTAHAAPGACVAVSPGTTTAPPKSPSAGTAPATAKSPAGTGTGAAAECEPRPARVAFLGGRARADRVRAQSANWGLPVALRRGDRIVVGLLFSGAPARTGFQGGADR